MALSKSVADVVQENENWLRLATFLHEPLKNALLHVLHNSSNDPAYVGLPDNPILLYQEFSKHGNLIAHLKMKKRVLQQDQIDLLLPPNSNKTDSSKFDVTFIVVLIINFTTLQQPLNGWKDKNPPAHDKSKGAGVIRGRQWRNFVHHSEPKDIDQANFNQKWAEGTQIISDLGYHYDTNKLKSVSLDSEKELVYKSLSSFKDFLEAKHDKLDTKQDLRYSNMMQQLNKVSNEVQYLRSERERNKYSDSASTGSCCLKSVLNNISKEIKEEEAEELLDRLNVRAQSNLVDQLKFVPWKIIKTELEMLGRKDVVEYIRKNTLITRGLQNASDNLRDRYKIELIECLVEQPLSSIEKENQYTAREDIFIDLVVLPSSTVDEEYTNSDRDSLIKQSLLNRSSTEHSVDKIIEAEDELIFIRGVAGIGKSTLIDMFTLKWAKNELCDSSRFDFVFKFTCRELNQVLTEFKTLEQLFKLQYPDIFSNVTLEDLNEVADRVLIVVDGLDELKDIYQMDAIKASLTPQAPFLSVIYNLINPKYMKSLKNHKTIVCGRPKACEFVKGQFSDFKIKTIEVCGFSQDNVQQYILNFFDKDRVKAKKVQEVIASSYNLKIMSTVPVFLWVICNVYSEELIKRPINTNTELYFYTCLILLRNHFEGSSNKYKNLLDIVQDENIIDVVYSLMVLSVKTYMKNQVLFTDEDIKKLKCPVHLEQTGFIVKYSLSNIAKSTYQFKHLILQEFLCGMYLCVTKGISPFLSNRELSSCLPTILGIHRIIQENENEIFLQFYEALLKSNSKLSNFFTKVTEHFKGLSYRKFIKKNTLKLPSSMIMDKTLLITDDPECREFLDLFKETNNGVDALSINDTKIKLYFYKDYNNVLNLLDELNITNISISNIGTKDFFDESGYVDEDILRLYEMTAGSTMRTDIQLSPEVSNDWMECTGESFSLCLNAPKHVSVKNILNFLEKFHIVKIHEFKIISIDISDESGNVDENILRLCEMTEGSSRGADIQLSSNEIVDKMVCTSQRLSLTLKAAVQANVINVLKLLEKLNITTVNEFKITVKDIIDESGNVDENVLRLYEMTAGSSRRADIQLSSNEISDRMVCTGESLSLSLKTAMQANVINILKVLEKLNITTVNEFKITVKDIIDESGKVDENILQLYEMTAGSIMITDIQLSSDKCDDWIEYTGEKLSICLNAPIQVFVKNILNFLKKLNLTKIHKFKIILKDDDEIGNMDENILQLYEITAGSSMRSYIYLKKMYIRNHFCMVCTAEDLMLYLHGTLSTKNIVNLLENFKITRITGFDIETEHIFDESGNIDENILKLYEMSSGSSMRNDIELHYNPNDELYCRSGELLFRLHPPLPTSLPEILKTTSDFFQINIYVDVLHHDTVPVFLQELTHYAVEHCKTIWFLIYSGRISSFKTLLTDAGIDTKSKYVQFISK